MSEEIDVHLRKRHPAQAKVITEARRFNVLACGRRFGKTALLLDVLISEPGGALEGMPVGWFAPSYKYLLEVWREALTILGPIIERKDGSEKRIELITGGVLDFWTLDDPDAGRSRKYSLVGVDEAAMARHLQHAWEQAIRPTLADYQGSAWFASSPKGFDFFKHLYDRGQDPNERDWVSWKMPTGANPFIEPSEIEAARLELPERVFNQEYLADFIEDGAGVFRNVRDAATATRQEKPIEGHVYVMGVDWGKVNDFTVLTVIDQTIGEVVRVERFNQIDYQFQLKRLSDLFNVFRPFKIIPEINSIGTPLIEQLQRAGMPVQPFQTTNASKADAIEGLALLLERGDLKILDEPVLISELQAYEAERLPSGMLRYNAPEGMHDDCVMSLALAAVGIREAPLDMYVF